MELVLLMAVTEMLEPVLVASRFDMASAATVALEEPARLAMLTAAEAEAEAGAGAVLLELDMARLAMLPVAEAEAEAGAGTGAVLFELGMARLATLSVVVVVLFEEWPRLMTPPVAAGREVPMLVATADFTL